MHECRAVVDSSLCGHLFSKHKHWRRGVAVGSWRDLEFDQMERGLQI